MSTEQQNQPNPIQNVTPPGTDPSVTGALQPQVQPQQPTTTNTNVTVSSNTTRPQQTPPTATRSPQLSPRKDDTNIALDTLNSLPTDSVDDLLTLTPSQTQQTTLQSLSTNPQQKTPTGNIFANSDVDLFVDDQQEPKKEKKRPKNQNSEQQQYQQPGQPGFGGSRNQGQFQPGFGGPSYATRSNNDTYDTQYVDTSNQFYSSRTNFSNTRYDFDQDTQDTNDFYSLQQSLTLSYDPEDTDTTPKYVEYQVPKKGEEVGQIKIHFNSAKAATPLVNQIERNQLPAPCKIEVTNQGTTIVLYVKNRSADDFKKVEKERGLKMGTFLVEDKKTQKSAPCFKFEKPEVAQKFFEGIFGSAFKGDLLDISKSNNTYTLTEKFFEHYAKPIYSEGLTFNLGASSTNISTAPLSTSVLSGSTTVVLDTLETTAPAKPITPPHVEFKAPTLKAAGHIEVTFKPEDVSAVLKQFKQLPEQRICDLSKKGTNTFSLTIPNTLIESGKKAGAGVLVERAKTSKDAPTVTPMFKFETEKGRDAFMSLFGMAIDSSLVKTDSQDASIVMVTPEFFAQQKAAKEAEKKPSSSAATSTETATKEPEKKFTFSSLLPKPKQPLPSYVIKPTNMEYKAPTQKDTGHIKVTFKPEDISAVLKQFNQLKESKVCSVDRKGNTVFLTLTGNSIDLVDKTGVGLVSAGSGKALMPAFKFGTEEGRDAYLKLFGLNIDDKLITIRDKSQDPNTVVINPEFFPTTYPAATPVTSVTSTNTNTSTIVTPSLTNTGGSANNAT